jgi:hypothetical protein
VDAVLRRLRGPIQRFPGCLADNRTRAQLLLLWRYGSRCSSKLQFTGSTAACCEAGDQEEICRR